MAKNKEEPMGGGKRRFLGAVLLVLGLFLVLFGFAVHRISTRPCRSCGHQPHVGVRCNVPGSDGFLCGCDKDR